MVGVRAVPMLCWPVVLDWGSRGASSSVGMTLSFFYSGLGTWLLWPSVQLYEVLLYRLAHKKTLLQHIPLTAQNRVQDASECSAGCPVAGGRY